MYEHHAGCTILSVVCTTQITSLQQWPALTPGALYSLYSLYNANYSLTAVTCTYTGALYIYIISSISSWEYRGDIYIYIYIYICVCVCITSILSWTDWTDYIFIYIYTHTHSLLSVQRKLQPYSRDLHLNIKPKWVSGCNVLQFRKNKPVM